MNRIFKTYGLTSPYDGIPDNVNAAALPLDAITVAGQAYTHLIQQVGETRGWQFTDVLKMILVYSYFISMLTNPTIEKPVPAPSAAKWKTHFETLKESKILASIGRSEIRFFSRYFAVPKNDGTARAIFNGRALSRLFTTPRNVNLPQITTVLQLISAYGHFFAEGDWRHFFHQFPVATGIANFFGVELGANVYRWMTMPMGFSFSPVIAQSAACTC